MAVVAGTKIVDDGLVLNLDAENVKTYQPGDLKWKDLSPNDKDFTVQYNLFEQIANPNPFGTSQNDQFGEAVAISDKYTIAASAFEGDSDGTSSGKVYIFENELGTLLHTLDNPNPFGTSVNDRFGVSVDINDTYAIVGAYLEDDSDGNDQGKAYIYNSSTGALLHTLDNPNAFGTSTGDYFGYSVAITNNYAAVSAQAEGDSDGTASGKVYVFNTSTGALIRTIDNPNAFGTSLDDRFGISLSISKSGAFLIVGAQNEDDAGGTSSGVAYIFNINDGTLLHTLFNPNAFGTSQTDLFGYAVDINDEYALVGAWREDTTSISDEGKAYIFSTQTGALLHTLYVPVSQGNNAYVGESVGLTDTYGLVGARNKGEVYVFELKTGKLIQIIEDTDPSVTDRFGSAVGISDNHLVIGARGTDDSDGTTSGRIEIYKADFKPYVTDASLSTTVGLSQTLDNPNPFDQSTFDKFGYSVAISDTYTIAGAIDEDDSDGLSSGKAYIFDNATGALLHTLDNPNPFGTSLNDRFGSSVDITDNYAIVGSLGEDDNDSDGLGSGRAYIFNPSTGALLHTLDNPNAFGTSANDGFGITVAINDNYAAVGAYQEDDSDGNDQGKVYVFNPTTGSLLYTIDHPNLYQSPEFDNFAQLGISDNYLIVGAPGERYPDTPSDRAGSGAVFVFSLTDGSLIHSIGNPTPNTNDNFGDRVAITDNYFIVGAFQDDTNGNNDGIAYIYDTVTGTLLHTLDSPFSSASGQYRFGRDVAITDNYAIVGQYAYTGGGAIHIFNTATGNLIQSITNPNAYATAGGENFGWSVGITDNYAVASAYLEADSNGFGQSGKAYIFDLITDPTFLNNSPQSSFSFNGTNYINFSDIPLITGLDPYTIDVWVNAGTQPTSPATIFSRGLSPNNIKGDYALQIFSGNIRFLAGGSAVGGDDAPFTTNEWINITGTFDGIDTITLYVNGVQVAQLVLGAPRDVELSTEPLVLGYNFTGDIATFKVYDTKALTADEVSNNFEALRRRFGL